MFSEFNTDLHSAFKYYFDVILKPFSRFMLKAIEKIKPLDIEFICPGHGPIHHENVKTAIDLSEKYSREYVEITGNAGSCRILIAYVSAYGYTGKAAEIIASEISKHDGIEVELADIENMDPGELDSRITMSDALIIGSPTINQNTLLPIYRMFALINPLRDKGKLAGSFGSYGWSGEASKIILENLRMLKLSVFDENIAVKFSPEGSKSDQLKDYANRFALKFLEQCGKSQN
jgi:flavorubredoxin